jgi:hypothetical protein
MYDAFASFLIIKANEMRYISNLFGKELYMFRTDLLPIIRSLNTVFTGIGVCHTSDVDCLLADCQLSETCRFLYQINLRNSATRWLLL